MGLNDHFLSWSLIYAFLIWVSYSLQDFFGITNLFYFSLFVGFIIAIGALIFYSVLYKNKIKIDKWFFIWFFTHSLSFIAISILLNFINLGDFIYFLIFGIIFHLITHFLKYDIYRKIKKKKGWIILPLLIIIIFLLGIFLTNFDSETIQSKSFSEIFSNINLKDNLLQSSCPQINTSMVSSKWGSGKELGISQYEGWTIKSYNSFIPNNVLCYKGNEKGENPNYWYCGEPNVYWMENANYGLILKTKINKDGTIGETIRKSFYNIYDENQVFIETICGEDPDKLSDEEFDGVINDLESFFD